MSTRRNNRFLPPTSFVRFGTEQVWKMIQILPQQECASSSWSSSKPTDVHFTNGKHGGILKTSCSCLVQKPRKSHAENERRPMQTSLNKRKFISSHNWRTMDFLQKGRFGLHANLKNKLLENQQQIDLSMTQNVINVFLLFFLVSISFIVHFCFQKWQLHLSKHNKRFVSAKQWSCWDVIISAAGVVDVFFVSLCFCVEKSAKTIMVCDTFCCWRRQHEGTTRLSC